MLRAGLSGPIWIRFLVLLCSLFDVVRVSLNMNLGRFPNWIKLFYIRVLLFQFGAISNPMYAQQRHLNRQATRFWYFGLPSRMRRHYQSAMLARNGIPMVAGGATIVGSRTGLFWKQAPGQLPSIVNANYFSGNVFFVDSNALATGTTSSYGMHPDKAIADVESAEALCTASQGDVIFVLPGHSETITDETTMDSAGISVLGLGQGSARPQFTQAVAGDCFALDAANVVLDNLYFNEATTAPASGGATIDINAANCKVSNCHFDIGSTNLESITITGDGDGAEIVGCTFVVTANGADAAIEIEAIVTEVLIHNCRFFGGTDTNGWDTGAINSGVAQTQCEVVGNRFTYGPAIIFTAAATGMIAYNLMGEGTLASMLDPGSCMCFENYEADAVDQSGRLIPTTVAS